MCFFNGLVYGYLNNNCVATDVTGNCASDHAAFSTRLGSQQGHSGADPVIADPLFTAARVVNRTRAELLKFPSQQPPGIENARQKAGE
ncbi:MAG: hypothetical protein ACI8R4_002420 [Paracoccaceae bacterium]|jgi:hypothetical protein